MFQEIPVSENNLFAFRVSGKLTDEDYRQFLPRLDELIGQYGKISLLFELDDFKGWEMQAAWDDLKYGLAHDEDFERIAVVGEKRWHRWITKFGNLMTTTEIRYFDRDDLQKAWDWLRHGDRDERASDDDRFEPEITPYRHLLVAIDFSHHAFAALKRAVALAKHDGARLSLVHAIEHIAFAVGDTDGVVVPYDSYEQDHLLFEAGQARLKKLADSLDHPDVHHEVIWGSPKAAILSYAEAQKVDLIVVGSHGHRGLARLMGSTSSALVHSAGCDVLVVRASEQDRAG